MPDPLVGPVVLDTSALLSGRPPSPELDLHAPRSILDEIQPGGASRRLLEGLLAAGLDLREPTPGALARVREAARGTGDASRLAAVDQDVLAVALDLGGTVLTDDYSVQNVASVLGLAWRGVDQPGIRTVRRWKLRCRGCHRVFEEAVGTCPVCGSEVVPVPPGAHARGGGTKG